MNLMSVTVCKKAKCNLMPVVLQIYPFRLKLYYGLENNKSINQNTWDDSDMNILIPMAVQDQGLNKQLSFQNL